MTTTENILNGRVRRWLFVPALLVTVVGTSVYGQWPQFGGPGRDFKAHAKSLGTDWDEDGRGQIDPAAAAPTPAEIAEFNDELTQLVASLPESEQQVLQLRLEQCTNEEIAEKLGCSERTVRRMMKRIQAHLTRLLSADDSVAS